MVGWVNDLLPKRHQAITWINAELYSIGFSGTKNSFESVLGKISATVIRLHCVNSLFPSEWNRSESTLIQVMACCLMAPSHYLNQFWLLTSKVLWHSLRAISPEMLKISILDMNLKITNLKLQPHLPRVWQHQADTWLNVDLSSMNHNGNQLREISHKLV